MLRHLLTIVTVLLFGLSVFLESGWAQGAAKHDDIKTLLTLTGARAIGMRASAQVLEMYKRANTGIPADAWQEILRDAEARVEEFVTERLVPIYDQYLSHDDIKALIVFYESPLGKKLLHVMPQMSQESMMAGQAWGKDFAENVHKKLAERGIKLP